MAGGPPHPPSERSRAFRERAKLEADRYGPDPWIFVRELLQNSRDAGASKVELTVGQREDVEWVRCYDDGEGMSFEHARKYLFALYASSKEGRKNQAGKFGVGFWSILRFEPHSIVIRSWPSNGRPWGIRLSGDLEHAEYVEPPRERGTEIVVERPAGDGRLEHRVRDAVWQSARYLHHRDDRDRPLPMTVNGRSVNAVFTLDAPSASFRRRSVKGVVGLGSAPRVELFCRGLRVRSAACLEDLVAPAGRHTSRMRVQFPELPGGLAPQALLESDALEVMLSRSDARDNRALGRLVRLAQRELERLIEEQLAHARPQPWLVRVWHRGASMLRDSLALRTVVGAVAGGVVAVLLSLWLWGPATSTPTTTTPTKVTGPAIAGPSVDAPIAVAGTPRPYADLGARYRGPRVDILSPAAAEPVPLRYAPEGTRLHFAALTFPHLAEDGSPIHDPTARDVGGYASVACSEECFDIAVPVVGGTDPMRVPVPTGHRIVRDSVRLGDRQLQVRRSAEDHPIVVLPDGAAGVLRYRTTVSVDPSPPRAEVPAVLPALLANEAVSARTLPTELRVERLLQFVRDTIKYDRSEDMADRHTALRQAGQGFLQRTLEIGAGDCDVQNGALVALLQASGVPARLAVGYLGVEGGVLPWLHAWVEYLGADGKWHVADASDDPNAPPAPPVPTVGSGPSIAMGDDYGDTEGGTWVEGDEYGEAVDTEGEVLASVDPPTSPTEPEPAATPTAPIVASPPPPAKGLRARLAKLDDEWPWLLPSIPVALLVFAAFALARGRMRRDTKLDDSADLSRLLQGVLQQPGAFGHMSALFHRPLVPLLGGRAISLQRARELASRGRLYASRTSPFLATRAARGGAAVLDTTTPEGRTVADALGAVDLDRWATRLQQASTTQLCQAVNDTLSKIGEPWSVGMVPDVAGGVASLDLAPLRARPRGFSGSRAVIIDSGASWLVEAEQLWPHAPQRAVFAVLDELAERLDLPDDRRAPLLAGGAQDALLEAFPS